MLWRRFSGRVGLAVLAAAGAGGAAPPAFANHEEMGDPVVVAGPTGDEPGRRLLLRRDGRELCLELGGNDGGDETSGSTCGSVPERDPFEPFVMDRTDSPRSDTGSTPFRAQAAQVEEAETRLGAGAVRANVAFVEYEVGAQRIRIPTTAAPAFLAGEPTGELRYFLGALPPEGAAYALRLLDANGTVLSEHDLEQGDDRRPPIAPPFVLGRGSDRAGVWRISATVERRLAPIRGDVTRRGRSLCVKSRRFDRDNSSGASTSCFATPLEAPVVDTSASCDPGSGTVLYGVAPPATVPRVAILGDGRRVRLRARALPAGFGIGPAVGFAARMPARAAVHEVIGRDGTRIDVGAPPPQLVECGSFTAFGVVGLFPEAGPPGPGGDVDIGAPGAPSLFVRDQGEELCAAVGRPAHGNECGEPGPWAASGIIDVSHDRRSAGGAVDPQVASVRVAVDDGSTFDVATNAGEGYTGRYAGKLRFFSAGVPAGRRIVTFTLLDAAGEAIFELPAYELRLAADAKPLVRAHGLTVATARVVLPEPELRFSCLLITTGALAEAGDTCPDSLPSPRLLQATVKCSPRAAVLLVGLTPASRSAEAVLRDGTRRRLVTRRGPAGERVAILVLPPRRALRSVVVRTRTGTVRDTYRLPMPPARRQCGYGVLRFGGFSDAP